MITDCKEWLNKITERLRCNHNGTYTAITRHIDSYKMFLNTKHRTSTC
ncbi:hypothetical protein GA0116948_10914 [Chitinophaga costaii]|uniref:Uncharacterized protein n=1 Tax=Chitinophaga costaii TaxID=1335309 RepID=A0A1C4ELI1_9BACT|nr:hypothetical protein GA0116948_10914 [Chitinophaga costaii]